MADSLLRIGIGLWFRDPRLASRVRNYLESTIPMLTNEFSHSQLALIDFRCGSVSEHGDGVLDAIDRWYREFPKGGLLLLSDQLVDGEDERRGTASAKHEIIDRVNNRLFASIVFFSGVRRIADIDRVVRLRFRPSELHAAMHKCVLKLDYLRPPVKSKVRHEDLSVTLVSSDETRLRDYFRLRHRVYCVMGYLDTSIENDNAEMDMDWFDRRSIHFGAYDRKGMFGRLLGTARLILTTCPENFSQVQAMEKLAEKFPVLQAELTSAVPLLLPVFQTHEALSSEFRDSVGNQHKYAELSRVVVDRDSRGIGLSKRICEHVVREAALRGVEHLYLECLPNHVSLYEGIGFAIYKGGRRAVYGANRTMVVMKRDLKDARVRKSDPAVIGADALRMPLR